MLTEQKVIEVINNLGLDLELDPQNTSPHESLRSLGIDSLDVFNILVELEELTCQKVPDGDVDKLTSINKIVEYFDQVDSVI